MKREPAKTLKKMVYTLVFLLCGAIVSGNSWAQTTAAIVDRKEITKAFGQILEVKTFIENLIKKATEKNDLVAKECLLPLLTSAQKMIQGAQDAKDQAIGGLDNNPPDLVKAGQGMSNLAGLREQYVNLFGEALACLSRDGTKKDWKEEVVKLIQPLITFSEGELFTIPEAVLEPKPWLSLFR